MHPTNADFGRRLVSTRNAATGVFARVAAGLLLLGLAAFCLVPAAATRQWRQLLPHNERVAWASAGLGAVCVCLGYRRFRRSGSAQHFYEAGACREHGGRRTNLPYAQAEGVTFVVGSTGTRLERSLAFAGPAGEPAFSLRTDLADDEAGNDKTPAAASVENVAARVIKAAAHRLVDQVDRGEVVQWTAKLWLDQAGLRVGEIRGVQWTDVKDGRITIRRSIEPPTRTAPPGSSRCNWRVTRCPSSAWSVSAARS